MYSLHSNRKIHICAKRLWQGEKERLGQNYFSSLKNKMLKTHALLYLFDRKSLLPYHLHGLFSIKRAAYFCGTSTECIDITSTVHKWPSKSLMSVLGALSPLIKCYFCLNSIPYAFDIIQYIQLFGFSCNCTFLNLKQFWQKHLLTVWGRKCHPVSYSSLLPHSVPSSVLRSNHVPVSLGFSSLSCPASL